MTVNKEDFTAEAQRAQSSNGFWFGIGVMVSHPQRPANFEPQTPAPGGLLR
jgi:hypothetical protein